MRTQSAAEAHAAPKVLVVEDEPALRLLIADVLSTDAGFCVIDLASGDEAIEFLKLNPSLDCVFTDVRMPGRHDGLALARHVQLEHPHIKVIMASGNLAEHERLDGIPMFTKPYDLWSVAEAIKGLVGVSAGGAAER
jgi:CheY-like chemotaxis protein